MSMRNWVAASAPARPEAAQSSWLTRSSHVVERPHLSVVRVDQIDEVEHVGGVAAGKAGGQLGVHVRPVVGGELDIHVRLDCLEIVDDHLVEARLVRRVRALDHGDVAGQVAGGPGGAAEETGAKCGRRQRARTAALEEVSSGNGTDCLWVEPLCDMVCLVCRCFPASAGRPIPACRR